MLRLSGLYGGSSTRLLDQVREGRIDDPHRWTNRIHRGDATAAVVHLLTMDASPAGLYLGTDDEGPVFAVAGTAPRMLGARTLGLREVGVLLDDHDAGLLVHAVGLTNWHATHTRCPRCGAPTEVVRGGSVRRACRWTRGGTPRPGSGAVPPGSAPGSCAW